MIDKLTEDFDAIWSDDLPWEELNHNTILVTGASGLIGTCMVLSLVDRNFRYDADIHVIALARNKDRLIEKFRQFDCVTILAQDVAEKIEIDGKVDYIVHAACDVQPKTSVQNPVGACKTIVDGTFSVCELAVEKEAKLICLSSINVFGQMQGEEPYSDSRPVYIPLNDYRYAYHEGKRMSEMICASYGFQKRMRYSSLRIGRVYGPTMNTSDSMVLSAFLYSASQGCDLTIKSDGKQRYTYVYVMDVIEAVYYLFFRGDNQSYNCGEAKQIEEENLGQIVQMIADYNGVDVHKEFLKSDDKKIYSNTVYSVMTSENLYELGWQKRNSIREGIKKTSKVLRDMYYE